MIKSLSLTLLAGLTLALVTGCGKSTELQNKRNVDFVCKQEGVDAPKWTCVPEVDDFYAGVGIAQKSDAGMDYMRRVALANGRSDLAGQISSQVKDKITIYTGTTGAGSDESVDKNIEVVTKQLSSVDLAGSKAVDMWTAPSGTLYMLVTVLKKSTNAQIQSNLKTSFKNDEALWQQFKAKNALESLEKDFQSR